MAYVTASTRRALYTKERAASYTLEGNITGEINTVFGPLKQWRSVWKMVEYYNGEKLKWGSRHPFDGNEVIVATHVKSGEEYYRFKMDPSTGKWDSADEVDFRNEIAKS